MILQNMQQMNHITIIIDFSSSDRMCIPVYYIIIIYTYHTHNKKFYKNIFVLNFVKVLLRYAYMYSI